jgi:hypothetical protein
LAHKDLKKCQKIRKQAISQKSYGTGQSDFASYKRMTIKDRLTACFIFIAQLTCHDTSSATIKIILPYF